MADSQQIRNIDPKLKEYATARQAKIIDAINQHGGVGKAARELGINGSAVSNALRSIRQKAALAGYAPEHDMTHVVPAPFAVKGVSTLYDEDGAVRAQWVKTTVDQARAEEGVRQFIEALTEDIKGKSKPVPAPKHVNADLLAVYPFGDPHFGMYAWRDEAGDDFDADIAERITCAAIDRLVECAPPAETAVILELGDLLHMDNSTNKTPQSGNILDADTRWARVMRISARAMIYCITKAASKHKRVIVKIVPGNHDPHSSYAIALVLDAHFKNNPRIEIDLSPAIHWYFRFGKVLIGSTHGDTTKVKDLPGVMAADRPREWGDTAHRYWYCGHVHHVEVREFPGVVCEYFRTLAAGDAWHRGQGYRAGRDMYAIIHHKEHGEIERHRCDVGMIAQ